MKLRKCPNATLPAKECARIHQGKLALPLIDILMRKMLQGILMCPRVNSNIAFLPFVLTATSKELADEVTACLRLK